MNGVANRSAELFTSLLLQSIFYSTLHARILMAGAFEDWQMALPANMLPSKLARGFGAGLGRHNALTV